MREFLQVLRGLAKTPWFVVVVTLNLSLGIGANTAIFSLFDQVILRLLPVKSPQELVLLESAGDQPGWSLSDNRHTVFSYPIYEDLQEHNTVFEGILARASAPVALAHGRESERADGELVSGNFFDVLGVRPLAGSVFHGEDDQPEGSQPVVVLSHGHWTRRFGERPDSVDEKITLNGYPMVVIGVAPPDFHGVLRGRSPDLYVPLSMRRQMRPMIFAHPSIPQRQIRWLNLMGRLKPGLSAEQAESAMQGLFRGILEDELAQLNPSSVRSPDEFLSRGLQLEPALQGIHSVRDRMETPLISMMALVGVVLLIACVNVASLLMARTIARGRETAIRLALGAGRWTLVRRMLVLSLVLASLGGGAGLLVASWTMDILVSLAPAGTSGEFSSNLNARVLGFNFFLAALTAVVFGLVPSLRGTAIDVSQTLKEQSSAGGEARRHSLFRRGAVIAQVALSTILLVAAGLFARSLLNLRNLDPGFRTANLLAFGVDPALNGYSQARGQALYTELLERLRRLPGASSAAAAAVPVLSNSARSGSVTVEGYRAAEGEDTRSSRNLVSTDYFRTMDIPVVLGRGFNERDHLGVSKVAVVNEMFVERYCGSQSPIGRHLAFAAGNVKLDIEIVGVVKNQKSENLKQELQPFVYTPYTQEDELPALTFYLRTRRDDAALGTEVRRVVRELDSSLPVFDMKTATVVLEESISLDRTIALLSSAFAVTATLLAAIGLYGLMAYAVTRRTREIGIRIALGALSRDVFLMVMKQAAWYLGVGLAVGIPLALALGRYLESQLFGLTAQDPLVVSGAALILLMASLLASLMPARRAVRLDPIEALREE